jgi:hypothetical protein
MTLHNLTELNYLNLLTALPDPSRVITGGICCDLLSWVMAKGQPGMAWITVQTHMNVAAVASLHELSCIIVAEGCTMPQEVLKKAEEEGIAVFSTPLSEYSLCGLLYEAGVK